MKTLLLLLIFISSSAVAQIQDFVGVSKSTVMAFLEDNSDYAVGKLDSIYYYSSYKDIPFALAFDEEKVVRQVIVFPYSMANRLMQYVINQYTELEQYVLYADFSESQIIFYRIDRDESLILTIHL